MQKETREYQKVIAYLSGLIADGELSIGSRLPTERSIAETLSVGRNSTREALRMMEHTGVIECRRGSGNYLTGNSSKPIADMVEMMLLLRQTNRDEICSFRRNMEKAVCRGILEGQTFSEWSEKAAEVLDAAQAAHSLEEQTELDRQFHFLLIHATENRFWIALMEPIAKIYRCWIDSALQCADADVKAELHQAHMSLFYALQNADWDSCERAIDRHYDLADRELRRSE